MRRILALLVISALLAGCVTGSLTGPASFIPPPRYGWTMADVRAHWGVPYSISHYGSAETWLYRRSYFAMTAYGNVIEAEYASVAFVDGKVVGISY